MAVAVMRSGTVAPSGGADLVDGYSAAASRDGVGVLDGVGGVVGEFGVLVDDDD